MDSRSFNSRAETFEPSPRTEPYRLFAYYHPQYQPECSVHQDDQYASFIFGDCEYPGESPYYALSANPPTNFDANGGYMVLNTLAFPEHDQFFAQHAWNIPPGKMSTYSELMPHVVAHKTTASLKRAVCVTTKSQPCVSPALCQGQADLPERAEYDDELDCPGELAGDEYVESSDDEEDDDSSHPPPPPSLYLSPSPSPFPSTSRSPSSEFFEPPRAPRVVRTIRTQSRCSPMEPKAPSSWKGKSVVRRASSGSDDEEPKKPKKRREAVSLACYFCRKRKIACRQPPEGSLDPTCGPCKFRGMDCEFPTESRRGARRASGSATSQKHTH